MPCCTCWWAASRGDCCPESWQSLLWQMARRRHVERIPATGTAKSRAAQASHSRGAGQRQDHAGSSYDSGKQIKGRKRHLLVDTLGLVLAVAVTAASVSDPAGARLLFRRLSGSCKKLRRIWVDGTYRGQLLVWVVAHFQFVLTPVKRSRKALCWPHRWIVERTFAWLCCCRRLRL